jgi:hypothetical protein
VRGINGIHSGAAGSIHYRFRNTGIWKPGAVGAMGICLNGDRSVPGGGANCCFWVFDNTAIALSNLVADYGIYLGQCDSNLFIGTHL